MDSSYAYTFVIPIIKNKEFMSNPIVSIIMAAYNREATISRAIDSVLNQNMTDWELIIIDDCSTDNTCQIINSYLNKDPRIKASFHTKNLHVHSAKNTGFDLMKGEWFTTLDSDDEMLPTALSEMLNVLVDIDFTIDAITCNCLDSTTGEYSGKGLNKDQWLNFETLITKCSGEHWGLTKSTLLGKNRFNCNMRGGAESILWWKISHNAKRYYIHKALRIYHTEGDDRLCSKDRKINIYDRVIYYSEMSNETEYLELMRKYKPAENTLIMRNISLSKAYLNKKKEARNAYKEIKMQLSFTEKVAVLIALYGGSIAAKIIISIALKIR